MSRIPQYYSQAGQDRFVVEMLGGPERVKSDGTFLEIGCCEPIKLSNTYALELLGWRGFMCDIEEDPVRLCREQRKSEVFRADATMWPWSQFPVKHFDYLSLDIDSATTDALRVIMLGGIDFRIATVEHDYYRFGPAARDEQRRILAGWGYHLYLPDVAHAGMVFEDWWVHPSLKDVKIDLSFVETAISP